MAPDNLFNAQGTYSLRSLIELVISSAIAVIPVPFLGDLTRRVLRALRGVFAATHVYVYQEKASKVPEGTNSYITVTTRERYRTKEMKKEGSTSFSLKIEITELEHVFITAWRTIL